MTAVNGAARRHIERWLWESNCLLALHSLSQFTYYDFILISFSHLYSPVFYSADWLVKVKWLIDYVYVEPLAGVG